jgi:hypothetical protein
MHVPHQAGHDLLQPWIRRPAHLIENRVGDARGGQVAHRHPPFAIRQPAFLVSQSGVSLQIGDKVVDGPHHSAMSDRDAIQRKNPGEACAAPAPSITITRCWSATLGNLAAASRPRAPILAARDAPYGTSKPPGNLLQCTQFSLDDRRPEQPDVEITKPFCETDEAGRKQSPAIGSS